ncbi:hypothetical protein [Streptomyces albireticuli]|uniref:Lipoprotein n=1 Tax=Streptomyces albireticuli TaxID=1940 RepID=A0A2A2D2W6_9ACTN|nr:hypothetical protein [Streptomyces albireticuli]MCD9144234.1 hypothetical protein [Streptomyces albireticuli]MCD9162123.1 hypothetical protein [Streptomyces albireticuli]MCD9193871.1 hypothetical protein [Streptomyces albireticuli]PAU45652.1 hypothetical protein CK936_28335 [Streptomyces albireticuli]
MRRTIVRRTAVTASAVSLALLVSACGSDNKSEAKDEPKGKASQSAPAAGGGKALSKAELEKLMVTEADVPGHKVTEATAADLATAKAVSSDKAECKPLVEAMNLHGAGAPTATVTRKVMALPKSPSTAPDASPEDKAKAALGALGATITADTLGAHSDEKAAGEALAGLKKAGAACAGGFTVTADGDKTKMTKVAPADYTAGDEAVAFTLGLDVEGQTAPTHLVAVRKGSTVATFYALSLTGQAEQPKAVVDAQVKKLG